MQERRPLSSDMLESDDAYLVVFDAPGVSSDDVQVSFADRTVEVRLDRFREFYEGYDMRFPGRGLTLTGSVDLPRDADVTPAGANATLTRSGTLQVRIPKDESATTVSISEADEIESAAGSEASSETESSSVSETSSASESSSVSET